MFEQIQWLERVKEVYDEHEGKGGFQVLFPSYHPNSSKMLANHLGLTFYDYRLEVMQATGWDANKLTLDGLTQTLHEESAKSGLVAHNIEALLAVKSEEERKQWLADFLSTDWSNAVILPISIYQGDTLEDHERVCDIELTPFPKESFLMRLAS